MEIIFEEFAQVENPLQHRSRGTGLGLPLSRKLAELLGGAVSVHSELGVGSTVTLRIPRTYSGPAAVAYVPEAGWQLDPTRTPVLIVEHDRDTLFTYESYLRGSGFQPIPARTLPEAFRALRDVRPALVLMGNLPAHEDVADLIAHVRRDERSRTLPIVHVSRGGEGLPDVDIRLPAAVDRQELLRTIRSLAQREHRDTILCVDDDPVARYLMRRLLSDTRYRFSEAEGGHEGLRLAREEQPALIMLDLAIPDPDGLEFLAEMEQDATLDSIPVLIVTGTALTAEEKTGRAGRTHGRSAP